MWLIGAKCLSKSGFLGVKWVYFGLKNIGPPTKLERQNGAKRRFFLKKRQNKRRERLEMVDIYLLYNLYFR